MKTITVTYQCDYCKRIINQDDDTVRAILPGRIGYQDSFLADTEDAIKHYHDYCFEALMTMEYKEPEKEPLPEEEPKKKNSKKDLGKLQSLINAKWTRAKIADEFGVSEATIYNWINELKEGR